MKVSGPWRAWLLVATLAAGCAPSEQAVLDRFFRASRLRDRTALGLVATVIFEPLEHGIVTRFDIVRVVSNGEGRKTVSVEAPVKLPDGQVSPRSFEVTMESRGGRWFVTSFTPGVEVSRAGVDF
jgi:hypothetical protein